jgi:hypothetical protein
MTLFFVLLLIKDILIRVISLLNADVSSMETIVKCKFKEFQYHIRGVLEGSFGRRD